MLQAFVVEGLVGPPHSEHAKSNGRAPVENGTRDALLDLAEGDTKIIQERKKNVGLSFYALAPAAPPAQVLK